MKAAISKATAAALSGVTGGGSGGASKPPGGEVARPFSRQLSTSSQPGSVLASLITNGGHSFHTALGTKGQKCNFCGNEIKQEGEYGSGVECVSCGICLHTACRGLARSLICAKPRVHSLDSDESSGDLTSGMANATLETAAGGPNVSSPKNARKTGHVSFRPGTGAFSGLEVREDMCLYFGAPLTGQPRTPLAGYKDRIPSILVLLAKELRVREGFETEGIFRISAGSGAVEKARDVLNMGLGITALSKEEGPHVCAALIKDWFRSLPAGESVLARRFFFCVYLRI